MADKAYYRADRYSIPAMLHGHVAAVLNTVQMPVPLAPRTLARVDFPDATAASSSLPLNNTRIIGNVMAAAGTTPITNLVTGSMTPAKLLSGYNIDSTATSPSSTQAVFATQTGVNGFNTFVRADLATFQSTYGIPSNPIAKFMQIAHPHVNDDKLPVITTYYSGSNVEACPKVRR